jgi:hypothetical protein
VNNQFRSISKIQVVDKNHQEELTSVLTQSVSVFYSHYQDMGVTELFVRYSFKDPQDPKAKVTLQSIISNTVDIKPTEFNLPATVPLPRCGRSIFLKFPRCW